MPGLQALGGGQIRHKIVEILRGQARVAHAANLLLVRQHRNSGVLRRLALEDSLQSRVSAHPVVVAVGADHAAVKANVHRFEGRDKFQLGGDQVAFHNAVLLVQNVHDVQLEQLLTLPVGERQAARQHIQVLAGKGLAQTLLQLILAQMGQNVGDGELGVSLFLSDAHGDFLPVLADDFTVERQGNRGPLVLLDAAVVVGF